MMCSSCLARPPREGGKTCEVCRERVRRCLEKRRRERRCVICGRPAVEPRKCCAECLAKKNTASKAYYWDNRERVLAKHHERGYSTSQRAKSYVRTEKRMAAARERAKRVRQTQPERVAAWKRADYLRSSDAYKARAIRHWFRKQYKGVSEDVIEMLVLGTEARRKMKEQP